MPLHSPLVRFSGLALAAWLVGCQWVAGLDSPLTPLSDAAITDASDERVSSAYAAAVLEDKPELYLRLDEASGLTVHDSSGNGNDGISSGNLALQAKGALAGDSNTAVEFADGNATITVPNRFDIPGGSAYSIELWVSADSTKGSLLDKAPAGPPNGTLSFFDMNPTNGVKLGLERWDNGTLLQFNHATVGLTGGVYCHVVFVTDGKAAPKLYLDGAPADGSIKAPGSGPGVTGTPFVYGGSGFRGKFDELAIYTHALAETRILLHFHLGRP